MIHRPFRLAHDLFRGGPKRAAWLVQHLPRRLILRMADARLVTLLQFVWKHAPAQRERWSDAGIRYRDLRSPEVLERIPFMHPKDLVEHGDDFLCVPRERLIHVIGTSGTSGQSKKIYLTAQDLDRQTDLYATKFRQMPGASRVLAVFIVDDPTWSTGQVVRRGIEKAGMFGLLAGSDCETPDLLDLVREFEIDTLVTTPTTAHRVTLQAACDLRTLGVRYIVLSGQPWTETLRAELEERWGAVTLDSYGANECCGGYAAECAEQCGLHVSDVDFRVEIVEATTGTPLPDGEEGEIVVTTLARRGMPLVRYRTGDLATRLPYEGHCACGVPLSTLSRIRGRIDDMLILGPGTNVYPDEIDEAVFSVPAVSDYQFIVDRDGYTDVIGLKVETDAPLDAVRPALIDALLLVPYIGAGVNASRTIVFGRIETVARGSLAHGRPKSVRIVDRRREDTATT